VVAYELDGRVRVLENKGGRGHWLRVRLTQDGKNRAALGATITARIGDRRIAGEIRTSGGYQSSVPSEVHLGFGELDSIDELIVRWPDGAETRHSVEALDRAIVVARPTEGTREAGSGEGSEESK
jgi:enediyne biosynthesis protein E4